MADYSGGTPQRVVLRLLVEFGKIPGYKTPNQVFSRLIHPMSK